MVPQFLLDFQAFVSQPWPWWVAGPMIALIMFLLLWFGKNFGVSDNFRILCAAEGAGNYSDFFKINWRDGDWNLLVALGAMIGGYMGAYVFSGPDGNLAHVSQATVDSLAGLGLNYDVENVPLVPEWISWNAMLSWEGWVFIILGGFLVGFGSRYAGGCTSGHAISGMSALELPSLVAVIGFFLGGLTMVWFIFPLIFN